MAIDSIWMKNNDIVRVLISLFLCYVLAIIYNVFITYRSQYIKHLSNVIFGIAICYFNFGNDIFHSLFTTLTVWSTIKLLGPSRSMVALNFIFCIGYLMYGYYQKLAQNINNITWTMPQCVLTLSLIALSFDIYDEKVNLNAITTEQKDEHQQDKSILSLLVLLSKVYFPPTFLIGPQIRFKDFKQFISLKQSFMNSCWKQSILRLLAGLVYYVFYQVGQTYLPSSFILTDQFKTYGLFSKLLILAISAKITLCKYIGAWLVVEGACILYGISKDPQTGLINRCFNMSLLYYEITPTFGGLIESFNMSTNHFALTYVYKRLNILRSKVMSQMITLFFLALWHGFASGYYQTFFMEMIIMKMEKDLSSIVIKYRTRNQVINQILNRTSIRWIIYLIMRLHVFFMFGYAFTSFNVLHYNEWNAIYSEVYYIGHLIYGSWFIISLILKI